MNRKRSVAEIATELGESFPKVLYWVKKHGITIRSCSERTYLKLNPQGDPFNPRKELTSKEKEIFLLGLAIYWAEGSRKVRYKIQVVNMDHRMLQLFVRFLRDIARVQESRLRLDVRVFHGFNKSQARAYWCRALSLKPDQVFVYPHIDHRSDPAKQWSPYGIATVSVANTKLKVWLDQQLENNIERLLSSQNSKFSSQEGGYRGLVRESPSTYTYV